MSTIQGAPVTRESRCMSRVTWGVTFGVSHGTPTRPDPARPLKYFRGYVCMHRYVRRWVFDRGYFKVQALSSYRARARRLTLEGASR